MCKVVTQEAHYSNQPRLNRSNENVFPEQEVVSWNGSKRNAIADSTRMG